MTPTVDSPANDFEIPHHRNLKTVTLIIFLLYEIYVFLTTLLTIEAINKIVINLFMIVLKNNLNLCVELELDIIENTQFTKLSSLIIFLL
jgi:hypothetical protein